MLPKLRLEVNNPVDKLIVRYRVVQIEVFLKEINCLVVHPCVFLNGFVFFEQSSTKYNRGVSLSRRFVRQTTLRRRSFIGSFSSALLDGSLQGHSERRGRDSLLDARRSDGSATVGEWNIRLDFIPRSLLRCKSGVLVGYSQKINLLALPFFPHKPLILLLLLNHIPLFQGSKLSVRFYDIPLKKSIKLKGQKEFCEVFICLLLGEGCWIYNSAIVMNKSKKQRKREKIEEKDRDFRPPYRKLHYQEYQIPPYSHQHIKALLLQYFIYDLFETPIHHLDIFNRIRNFYQNFQNADIYMKDLDLPDVLAELEKNECLITTKRALGTKLVTIVERIYRRRTYDEYEKCRHLRPVTPPPDPITFQQQKREATPKEKEQKLLIDNLLNAPSLFNEKIDIDVHLQKYGSYEQKIEALEFKAKKNLEYCDHCTRDRCQKAKGHALCTKKHFRAIINQKTDESFGNCPHLNACHNPDCKLIHYVEQDQQSQVAQEKIIAQERMLHAEWINCDMRYFDFKILGKFDVVMADPPWDIHMSLPYGTLKDKELLNLRVDILQDQGLIFLWVTGRAMELGRQCLAKWGYKRVDEIVWIKTNQINRLIITGKTGHWLNHTKEHCLVGIKGNPKINTKLDCDVIVSKVRETSRKPDEIYGMIERMNPGGKKVELFGRPDNCMPGWLTLGNQLMDVRLKDPEIIARYKKAYPQQELTEDRMGRNLEEMSSQDNLHKIYNNHIQKNTA